MENRRKAKEEAGSDKIPLNCKQAARIAPPMKSSAKALPASNHEDRLPAMKLRTLERTYRRFRQRTGSPFWTHRNQARPLERRDRGKAQTNNVRLKSGNPVDAHVGAQNLGIRTSRPPAGNSRRRAIQVRPTARPGAVQPCARNRFCLRPWLEAVPPRRAWNASQFEQKKSPKLLLAGSHTSMS